MSQYIDFLQTCQDVSMQEIISACKSSLPDEWKSRPYHYPELHNGTAILQTEDGLNAYMAAYGEMHCVKMKAALQNFPFSDIAGTVEIVDWGCGQGVGSMCCVEMLKEHDLQHWLKRVTLIEPSDKARLRAKANVERATNGAIPVMAIGEYLPSDDGSGIPGLDYRCQLVIHIFSNILDIPSVNLLKLADMVSTSGRRHAMVCTGPLNAGAKRIDMFCDIFGNQQFFSQITDPQYGHTSDTYYNFTCKTKCFVYNGEPLDRSKYIYDPGYKYEERYDDYDYRLSVQNGGISKSKSDLSRIFRAVLNPEDLLVMSPDIHGDKPDFVVVRPNKGILLVTIFEDDIHQYIHAVDEKENIVLGVMRDESGKDILSPLNIINTYQQNLIRLHMEDMLAKTLVHPSNWGLVKKMVVFSKNSLEDVRGFFSEQELKYISVFGQDIYTDTNLQHDLLRLTYLTRDNQAFDDRTMRSFLRVISPRWHSYKQGKHVNLTPVQNRLARSVADTMQKISGVAGSGKTQVLATRAVNAQIRTGKDVLVLTFNIALANYMRYRIGEIRADFPWYKITVSHFHQFFKAQANRCGLQTRLLSYDNVAFFKGHEDDVKKYAAIFIDEVQDYKTEWLQMLNRYFLEEHGEFVVFGDPKQNIYKRPLDTDGNIRIGFIGGRWNQQLKDSMRFVNPQLAKLAMDYQSFYFKNMPTDIIDTAVQRNTFTQIKHWNIGHNIDARTIASNCLWVVETFKLKASEVAVLSQSGDLLREIDYDCRHHWGKKTVTTFASKEDYMLLRQRLNIKEGENAMANYKFKRDKEALDHNEKVNFSFDTDALRISTIHSFKGWEAPTVILVLQPEASGDRFSVSENENSAELIYTAITRAKENLFILNLGNEKYLEFINRYN